MRIGGCTVGGAAICVGTGGRPGVRCGGTGRGTGTPGAVSAGSGAVCKLEIPLSHVCGPTTPSAVRPEEACHLRVAVSVTGPHAPAGFPENPEIPESRFRIPCHVTTAGPLIPSFRVGCDAAPDFCACVSGGSGVAEMTVSGSVTLPGEATALVLPPVAAA